jgi:uncharacterized protein YqfB (UPF0267 family)
VRVVDLLVLAGDVQTEEPDQLHPLDFQDVVASEVLLVLVEVLIDALLIRAVTLFQHSLDLEVLDGERVHQSELVLEDVQALVQQVYGQHHGLYLQVVLSLQREHHHDDFVASVEQEGLTVDVHTEVEVLVLLDHVRQQVLDEAEPQVVELFVKTFL